jgi:carbon monoxide dehydrogenase subunit G
MTRFTVAVDVAAPIEAVWARITDWPVHGRWIPFTTVKVTSERPGGVGASFVGRSAIGPFGFDDPMTVTAWSPPLEGAGGHCEVLKTGRVLLGRAEFDVLPRADGATTVYWVEDVQLAPVAITRPLGPLIAAFGRIGFTRALAQMASELEREVPGGG